ncbi:MAG: thiamine phosphate synthase [Flavobacteriales bacterium]|nr:thiamine phosphate synthase [Flavobacteriales bacterium]
MLVLIAPEEDIKDEHIILNQLFKAGLEYYHLRKPTKDYEGYKNYLGQIDRQFHNRVVVHQFHELTADFQLKGVHFQEHKRRTSEPKELSKWIDREELTVSSSFHELKELEDCEYDFDYHLLSPVFSSISKKGYEGRGFNVKHISKKTIGMGGINADKLKEISQMGYDGVGVLGAIWKSKEPVEDFKQMLKFYQGQ